MNYKCKLIKLLEIKTLFFFIRTKIIDDVIGIISWDKYKNKQMAYFNSLKCNKKILWVLCSKIQGQ